MERPLATCVNFSPVSISVLYLSKGQSLPQNSCLHSFDIIPISKIVFCQRQVVQGMLGGVATSEVLKEWRCRTRILDESNVPLDLWCDAGMPQSVWAMSDGPSTRWSWKEGEHGTSLSWAPSNPTQPYLAGLYGHICWKGKLSLLPHFAITLAYFFVVYLTQMTIFCLFWVKKHD